MKEQAPNQQAVALPNISRMKANLRQTGNLTIHNVPLKPEEISRYYDTPQVTEYYDSFNRTVNIKKTIEQLLQAVDLIALAYQKSFDNGLKCAPMTAEIKTGYLSLVSDSSAAVLDFKKKSTDAVFKLAMAAKYFIMIDEIQQETSFNLNSLEKQAEGFVQDINEMTDPNSEDGQEQMQYILEELNGIRAQIGLSEISSPVLKKFAVKKELREVQNELELLKEKVQQKLTKKAKLFATAIEEIAGCSRYASEMENTTDQLIEQVSTIKQIADNAFKNCVEQDVNEKEKKQKLEEEVRTAEARKARLATLQKELENEIDELKTQERKLEKRLESASTKAFISGLVSSVAGAVGAGLNAYVSTQTFGLSNLKQGLSTASDDGEEKLKEMQQKEAKAKGKKEAAQLKFTQLEEKITELKQEKEEAETKKTAAEEKLKDEELSEEEKTAQETAKSEAEKEITRLEQEIKSTETEKKSAKSELNDYTSELKAASTTLQEFSKSFQQFREEAKSEIEALEKKAGMVYEKRMNLQKEKRDAVAELAEIVVKLKNAGKAKEGLDELINALKITSETIQKIIVAFQQIKRFWQAVKGHCEELSVKGASAEKAVETIQAVEDGNFKEVFDKIANEAFIILTYSWIGMVKVNDVTLQNINRVVGELEKTFQNRVDVNQLCDKVKDALDQESKLLEAPQEPVEETTEA